MKNNPTLFNFLSAARAVQQFIEGNSMSNAEAGTADTGTEWYFGVPFPSKRKAVEAGKPEPKYKVGQRVLVVDARGGGKIGDTGPITKIEWSDSDDSFYYHINGLSDCAEGLFERRIELIIPPTFLPDTRVRLKRHVHRFAAGDMGTVTVANDENVGVLMDGGRYWSFKPDDLEAMPAPWGAPDCAGRKEEREAKPKFKAGDVVRCLQSYEGQFTKGSLYVVIEFPNRHGHVGVEFDDAGSAHNGLHPDKFELAFELAAPCPQDNEQADHSWQKPMGWGVRQPAIVALINKDGKPRPSQWPHVHPSVADATKEAERLARINPGQEFAVYQRVAGRRADVEMKEVA
jgi:hypothetical protein